MTTGGVRLQDLRDFTVQIRRLSDDRIVGTGIVVSMDGKVLTCAHVVEMADVDSRAVGMGEIGVYFPQVRSSEEKERRATVSACFTQHDDDVVLLQLVGGPARLGVEQVAVLGTADRSEGNRFRSFGYSPLGPFPSSRADGIIQGEVDKPCDRIVQADPIQLKSSEIARGMSGAAVLDVDRNLVVGIISETWFPDSSTKHRDTSWAVNARVFSFEPLNVALREASLPKRVAHQPRVGIEAVRTVALPRERNAWNNAPPPLEEWVGRRDLLQTLGSDWADPNLTVTGLIGFGGEGKSSLARRWVDELLEGPPRNRPDGVFWWSFYTRPSMDEFFEAALNYLGGVSIDPHRYPLSSAKARLVAALLNTARYVFVLDGLEAMQCQEGDQYGLLRNAELRELLTYFAAPGHGSFCLITSRAPLLDLMDYTSYTHREVERMSLADGRALLCRLGVQGQDEILDGVVTAWDGHALTLSLVGSYVTEQHGGDATKAGEIMPPTADEPRYERVHRVLRRYDENLTEAERTLLMLFAAFRTPMHESALDKVFRAPPFPTTFGTSETSGGLTLPFAALTNTQLAALIRRLCEYRLLRHDPHAEHYTAHPLVRAHYLARLTLRGEAERQDAHVRIKDYYLGLVSGTPYIPSLEDLEPLIEVVHHNCQAGAYDDAWRIFWDRIYQGNRKVLVSRLGASETALNILLEFFPGGDASRDPQISVASWNRFVLNEVGLRLADLGRLDEVLPFYERTIQLASDAGDWSGVSSVYQNLVELYWYLGKLKEATVAAQQALEYARLGLDTKQERYSVARQAWTAHLRGELDASRAVYERAEQLERIISPARQYLSSLRGVQYADHLRRTRNPTLSREVTMENLRIVERNKWSRNISQCHRVLGDLEAETGQHENAYQHYSEALRIAQGISRRDALIEALLARGRWAARHLCDAQAAFGDLYEALGYATDGGYRIYEADLRVASAWAHLASEDLVASHAEAEHARRMSERMGYYWGQVDAEEVLEALAQS